MKSFLLPTYILHILWFSFSIFGCGGSGGGSGGGSSSENTVNTAPIAVIQAETSVTTGVAVGLDGMQSRDADGDQITFLWNIVSLPIHSEVQLFSTNGPTPYFIPDFDGAYVFSLIVNDGKTSSNPATVTINSSSKQNVQPIVKAFTANPTYAPPGDTITFSWTIRDTNNDKISCTLDVTGGGTIVQQFDDCLSTTTFSHAYDTGGNFVPRLTLNDGKGGSSLAEAYVNIASAVQLYIHTPQYREPSFISTRLIGASLDIKVLVISSTVEVNSIRAKVEDRQTVLTYKTDAIYYKGGVAPAFVGTLSLDGLNRGEKILEVTATDVSGIETLAYRRFFFDKVPELTISAPLDNSVATPNLPVDIVCTDDSGSCNIKVGVYGYTLLASATDKLVQIIDLSAFNGQQIKLIIQGIDSFHQETRVELSVFVESSNNLSLVTSVDGPILDLNEQEILYVINHDDGDSLYVCDWMSDVIRPVPVPSSKEMQKAFLTPTGAIFGLRNFDQNSDSYHAYDWRSGALIDLEGRWDSILAVSGDYAIFSVDRVLWLRRFSDGSNNIIANGAGAGSVGSNGVVAYLLSSNIFSYVAGITKQLTNDSRNDSVTTDGNDFVYEKINGYTWPYIPNTAIAYHNGTTETLLTSYRARDPIRGSDYQINNGWIAYTEYGNLGQLHVWTRSPQGLYQQRTLFGTYSGIDKIGENGDLMLTNSRKRYLSLASGELFEKCSSLGKSYRVGGKWYVVMGRSLFQVK